MVDTRHVWARRNYAHQWLPGLVVEWRHTPGRTGPRWDALCLVLDGERSWLEWFGSDELRPITTTPPPD